MNSLPKNQTDASNWKAQTGGGMFINITNIFEYLTTTKFRQFLGEYCNYQTTYYESDLSTSHLASPFFPLPIATCLYIISAMLLTNMKTPALNANAIDL